MTRAPGRVTPGETSCRANCATTPRRRSARARPILALTVSWMLEACATAPVRSTQPAEVRAASGRRLSFETMLDELSRVRLVCFGERHDDASDHALEARLVRGLLTRGARGAVAIGLEMIEHDRQPVLDAFAAGASTLDALPSALEFEARWGRPFTEYEPIFAAARDGGARVIALNARREVVRAVMREGPDAARQRFGEELPSLDISPRYEAFVGRALEGHEGLDDQSRRRFVLAQRTWDATMAEHAVAALGDDPSRRVVVIAGAMHCAYGIGIPDAARRLGESSVAIVLPEGAEVPSLDDGPRAGYVVLASSP